LIAFTISGIHVVIARAGLAGGGGDVRHQQRLAGRDDAALHAATLGVDPERRELRKVHEGALDRAPRSLGRTARTDGFPRLSERRVREVLAVRPGPAAVPCRMVNAGEARRLLWINFD